MLLSLLQTKFLEEVCLLIQVVRFVVKKGNPLTMCYSLARWLDKFGPYPVSLPLNLVSKMALSLRTFNSFLSCKRTLSFLFKSRDLGHGFCEDCGRTGTSFSLTVSLFAF